MTIHWPNLNKQRIAQIMNDFASGQQTQSGPFIPLIQTSHLIEIKLKPSNDIKSTIEAISESLKKAIDVDFMVTRATRNTDTITIRMRPIHPQNCITKSLKPQIDQLLTTHEDIQQITVILGNNLRFSQSRPYL